MRCPPIRFRRPVSGCPAVWCAARPVSSPVRCPVTWVRRPGSGGPAVRCPPVQRPAVWCPPIQRPALRCPPPSVRTRPSPPTSGGGVGDQMGAERQPAPRERVEVPWRPRRGAARSTGRGLDDAGDATEVARWSVGFRRRTRPGWVRAVAAALARCPTRQARPACGAPVAGGCAVGTEQAAARGCRTGGVAAVLGCARPRCVVVVAPEVRVDGPGRADGLAGGDGRAAPARPRLAASLPGSLPTAL
jgi:hypothetical protein